MLKAIFNFSEQKTLGQALLFYFVFYVFATLIIVSFSAAMDDALSLAQKEDVYQYSDLIGIVLNSILCLILLHNVLVAKGVKKANYIYLYITAIVFAAVMGLAGLAAALVPATLATTLKKEK